MVSMCTEPRVYMTGNYSTHTRVTTVLPTTRAMEPRWCCRLLLPRTDGCLRRVVSPEKGEQLRRHPITVDRSCTANSYSRK